VRVVEKEGRATVEATSFIYLPSGSAPR